MKISLKEPFVWRFNGELGRYELVVRPGEFTEELIMYAAQDIIETLGDSPGLRKFFVTRLMQ